MNIIPKVGQVIIWYDDTTKTIKKVDPCSRDGIGTLEGQRNCSAYRDNTCSGYDVTFVLGGHWQCSRHIIKLIEDTEVLDVFNLLDDQ